MDYLPFLNSVVEDKGASVKSKHIIIRLVMINEAYANGDIDLKHMSAIHISSDMLSKLVPAPTHQYLRKIVTCQQPSVIDSTISLPNGIKASSEDNLH